MQRVRNIPNVAEVIADSIAELVFTGELRPGELLRQEDLAGRFGVSRVPVRDALHILERRGLVETAQRRGVRIRHIDRKTIVDLYGLRQALETHAIREACRRADPAAFARLKDLVDQQRTAVAAGDIADFIRLDDAFHAAISELGGNDAVTEALTNTWARINQVRGVARTDPTWGQAWASGAIANHERILAAFAAQDPNRCAAVVESILAEAAQALAAKLERSGWFDETPP